MLVRREKERAGLDWPDSRFWNFVVLKSKRFHHQQDAVVLVSSTA